MKLNAAIATGGLSGAEVLLVPDGYALKDPSVPSDPYGYKDLGPKGRANLKAWVQNGGRYVGWLDGGVLASVRPAPTNPGGQPPAPRHR